jgi:hypothetical protein
MVYGLSAFFARIHDDAISLAKALLAGDLRRHPMQVAQHRTVGFAGILHGPDMLAGNDEDVRGSLRMKVRECVARVILIDGGRRNGAFSDLAEDAAHGENSVQRLLARMVQDDLPTLRAFAPHEGEDAVVFLGFAFGSAVQVKSSSDYGEFDLAAGTGQEANIEV